MRLLIPSLSLWLHCQFLAPALLAAEMPLVRTSEPASVILVAADASAHDRGSAQLLQQYIAKCTGATLPIVEEGSSPIEKGRGMVYVGQTAFAKKHAALPQKLDADGFILQQLKGEAFIIAGGSEWGTEFGVYEFLERYLGVRWLAPTELFTITPHHESVFLPEELLKKEPVFLSREFFPIEPERKVNPNSDYWISPSMSPYLLGDQWGRRNKLRARVAFHHNLRDLLPPSRFGNVHPEFYPILDGERFVPPSDSAYQWQPNFSAPGIAETSAREIIRYFDENPKAESYSLGVNDSHRYDESEASRKRRTGKKNSIGLEDISNDYYRWTNDVVALVKKSHPTKSFGLLAYLGVIDPPTTVKIDASIVPYITYELSRWRNPEARKIMQGFTEAWEKAAPVLGWYDYPYGSNYVLPRTTFQAEGDALAWAVNHHVQHYYGEAVPNWADGPKMWMLTRLFWNPNENVDELVQEWVTAAVGPAAAPKLIAFYKVWEAFWETDILSSPWYSTQHLWQAYDNPLYLSSVKGEQIQHADALIKEALQLVQTPGERQRMEALVAMWELQRLSAIVWLGDQHWNDAHISSEEAALAWLDESAEIIELAMQRLKLINDMSTSPLFGHSIYRIASSRTGGETWGTARLWSILPWARSSERVRKRLQQLAQKESAATELFYYDSSGVQVPLAHKAPEVARQILEAAASSQGQLMKNPSFEDGLKGWSRGPFAISRKFHLDGEASLAFTCAPGATLSQAIPYQTGVYHAEIAFLAPEGVNTEGRVMVEMKVTNNAGVQMGPLLPKATLTPRPGEWVTTVIAFELGQLSAPAHHISMIVTTEGFSARDTLYFDRAGITASSGNARNYRGVGPDGM